MKLLKHEIGANRVYTFSKYWYTVNRDLSHIAKEI